MDTKALIQAYLDAELTDAQFAELSAWLQSSEANREAFVRATWLDTDIRRHLAQSDLHAFLEEVDIFALQDVLNRVNEESTAEILSNTDTEVRPDTDELTVGRAIGILSRSGMQWAGQSLRRHAVGLGLAAAVVLAATLFFVLRPTDPTPQTPPVVEKTPPSQPQPVMVATLTAEHNAVWSGLASASLAPGLELRAGERLTLTQGFAEITTGRGSIVILEAPATIEVINSNAVFLHTGKLVGLCKSESSKGFVVRTGHADITDLGTEFGVEASAAGGTYSQVFDGMISIVSSAGGSDTPVRMGKGQAGRVLPSSPGLALETFEPSRFVRSEQLDALAGKLGEPERMEAVRWLQLRSAQQPTNEAYSTGDEVIAIQAEDFVSIDLSDGGKNPWEIRQLADNGGDAASGQATVLFAWQDAGRKSRTVNYNLRFRQPGVYYLYLRAAFTPVRNDDISYGDAIYHSAPGADEPFLSPEEGLIEEDRLRQCRWLKTNDLLVDRLDWWDPTNLGNAPAFLDQKFKRVPSTAPRRFVVTEADLDKTHRFVLAFGEPGVAIDGLVFAQRDDLKPEELDRLLKSAQRPQQP